MPTLSEDARLIVENVHPMSAPWSLAARRLARAYLDAFRIRTVSENCQRLTIVDADHYEALLARMNEIR